MKLDIIIKTCDVRTLHGATEERFCKTDKSTIIKKCLSSLMIASNNRPFETNITVIDDGSSIECLKSIEKILKASQHKTELIARTKNDYNESTLQYFQAARDSEATLVYLVEDDYLHFPMMLGEMENFYNFAFEQLNRQKDIVIHPFDDPANYSTNRCMETCHVVLGKNKHWRTNYYTTCTFFTTPGVVRRGWNHFENFANNYILKPEISEDTTINQLWRQPEVQLFTPLTSLALHMQFEQNRDRMVNWKELCDLIPEL
jgi:hypothetical protein